MWSFAHLHSLQLAVFALFALRAHEWTCSQGDWDRQTERKTTETKATWNYRLLAFDVPWLRFTYFSDWIFDHLPIVKKKNSLWALALLDTIPWFRIYDYIYPVNFFTVAQPADTFANFIVYQCLNSANSYYIVYR